MIRILIILILLATALSAQKTELQKMIDTTYKAKAYLIPSKANEFKVKKGIRVKFMITMINSGDEGFELNLQKSRAMGKGSRQHACGLTLNSHANISRRDFDQLKATLHNCVRFGPVSQNRGGIDSFRRHLEGRVAYVQFVNPVRGAKLARLLEQIDWHEYQ